MEPLDKVINAGHENNNNNYWNSCIFLTFKAGLIALACKRHLPYDEIIATLFHWFSMNKFTNAWAMLFDDGCMRTSVEYTSLLDNSGFEPPWEKVAMFQYDR